MQLVLILEDDVMWRATMARSLNKLPSIEVVEAGSINEAIRLLEGLDVDLLLTDLQLGDGTAIELLPHLKRSGRRIPIIVVSGWIDEFAGQLPAGVEMRPKPIGLMELRELVARTLGCADPLLPPFTLADYVQLACFGRYSVQIELARAGEFIGALTMREGQAWCASDAEGEGMPAFLGLVAMTDVAVICNPIPSPLPPRTLAGSGEHLLMEAARLTDHGHAARLVPPPAEPAIAAIPTVPPVVRIPPRVTDPPARPTRETPRVPTRELHRQAALPAIPPPAPARTPTSAWVTARVEPATAAQDQARFDVLYGQGIDALLAKRYVEAYDALSRAKQIRTTPTLEANLIRLRALGVA